jgi:hypothetical protein
LASTSSVEVICTAATTGSDIVSAAYHAGDETPQAELSLGERSGKISYESYGLRAGA